MNQLVISLIVLLIPGLIAALVYDSITQHEKWNNFTFSVAAILFGWFSYLPLYLINWLFSVFSCLHINFRFNILITLLKLLNNEAIDNSIYMDIIFASVFAIGFAFLTSRCVNRKYLNHLAQKMHISSKYGDENLFSYYLNSDEIDWVYVRWPERNLIYRGLISKHSETLDIQEIVLLDVDIYNYRDSAFLYHVKTIYLCGKAGDFTIELAKEKKKEDDNP
ncbi:hypothetical protein [Candidatus Tokpelaia sp.]|uniref:hypothetical protein n=1 Tax=Candidatus Tokpelaia sp. TaxID=2233777 RepID=UPI00123A6B38|nr:hypothetical protein [Candidatus Tokpelaia sp.]